MKMANIWSNRTFTQMAVYQNDLFLPKSNVVAAKNEIAGI